MRTPRRKPPQYRASSALFLLAHLADAKSELMTIPDAGWNGPRSLDQLVFNLARGLQQAVALNHMEKDPFWGRIAYEILMRDQDGGMPR
ncbi:MAG: hypothetical protein DI629_03560 [Mesorhizobium amorphae]|nr:MAG: hypothetical protein DI629_03560 [Mesorhizobium amorphae]